MTAPTRPRDSRRERLEKALRDNLRRRKAQARERAQEQPVPAEATGADGKLSGRKS